MPKFGFRFSIRTLLLTMTFFAMVITWITYERRQSNAEQLLAKKLQARGNEVVLGGPYDVWHWPNTLRSESWWERLAERTLGQRIRGVLLEPTERDRDLCALSDLSDLTPLMELRHLRQLDIAGLSVPDQQIDQLRKALAKCKIVQ